MNMSDNMKISVEIIILLWVSEVYLGHYETCMREPFCEKN